MVYHPFRNLGLKGISIVLAAILWLSVSGQQIVERSLLVPLELVNTPKQLELVENPPQTVAVRVRGSSGTLSEIQPGAIVTVLDVASARARQQYFHLTPGEVRAPFGVEVMQVSPGTISLRFERSISRAIPVRPVIEGTPAEGHQLGRIVVEPERVEVVGPESAIDDLREALTEPIDVSSADRSITETVTIRVDDPLVRLSNPSAAKVTVEVMDAPQVRTFTGVPVRLRGLGRRVARPVPATISVEFRVVAAGAAALRSDALEAFVDLANLKAGRYALPVSVEPIKGIEIVRTQPAIISVRIQ